MIQKRHDALKDMETNESFTLGLQNFLESYKCDLEKSIGVLVRCNLGIEAK